MALDSEALVAFVRGELSRLADPEAAVQQAAYMKTDMPFYGIKAPQLTPVTRQMVELFPATSRDEYQTAVLVLWEQPHREEKYAAISYARRHPRFVTASSIRLYRRLIREGAWWDLVDGVAIKLVGRVVLRQGDRVWATMDRWISDRDLWVRRSALLCQIDHKGATDETRLFDYCLGRSHEREFFIRKAIGWALRQYSYVAPEPVKEFLSDHGNELSGLSQREAAKGLRRLGLMD